MLQVEKGIGHSMGLFIYLFLHFFLSLVSSLNPNLTLGIYRSG